MNQLLNAITYKIVIYILISLLLCCKPVTHEEIETVGIINLKKTNKVRNRDGFWKKVDLGFDTEKQKIYDIFCDGDSTILIVGTEGESITEIWLKSETNSPFLCISKDKGNTWSYNNNFKCNSLESIKPINDSTVFLFGYRHTGNPDLYRESEAVWFIYSLNDNSLKEFEIIDDGVLGVMYAIEEGTYISGKNLNYANHQYLMTENNGKNWTEHSLPFQIHDTYSTYNIFENKLWGVLVDRKNKGHEKQFIVSVNLNSWKIENKISIGEITYSTDEKQRKVMINSHKVLKIVPSNKDLFVFGLNEKLNENYISRLNLRNEKIIVQDTFKISSNQSSIDFFIYNNQYFIITQDDSHMPSFTLAYKKSHEKNWMFSNFPYSTNILTTHFCKGTIVGIYQGSRLFFKTF